MQTDDAVQGMFNIIKNIRWRDSEESESLKWYYAENCHYIVKDTETNAYWFVTAKSPVNACDYVIGKLGGSK